MATQLFLRNTASDLGGAGQKALSTSRGAASVNKTTNTVASGNNVQVTDTAGGQVLVWLSSPLNPVTITGNITVNIRGLESATAANAAAGVLIERVSNDGATVLGTILASTSVPTASNEYTTADTAKNASFVPTASTTLAGGDRIRVSLLVRAASGVVMGGARTVTNSIDGPTAGAAGDTYVTFTETLAAFSGQITSPGTVGAVAGIGAPFVSAAATVFATALAAVTAIPTPPRPQAAFVKMVGTAIKTGTSTATTLTLGAGVNVAAGNRLVVAWAGTLLLTSNAISCDDSKGNNYTLFHRASDGSAEIVVGWFSSPITTGLAPGDTITVTQGGDPKDQGWIAVEEWSGLTIPGQGTGQSATSSTPSSGSVAMEGGAVYFGLLGTYNATAHVTGSLGSPWTNRATQANSIGIPRWFGIWDRQLPTGDSSDFQPTIGSSTLWATSLVALTAGTEPPTPTIIYSWVGGVTPTGVVITAKTNNTTSVRVAVSTSPLITGAVFTTPAKTPDANGYTRHTVTGLTPAATYYYAVELDGTLAGSKGQFIAAPSTAGSFSFAVGSCSLTQATTSWARALARTPTLGVISGDFPYADVTANDQNPIRNAREAILSQPAVHEFVRKVASVYTWSDHDFGANNANTTSPSKPAAQAVYRLQVPHHPLEVADAIYHTFTYGPRVRFVLTDNRSFKSLQTDTDNSSKTVLGTTQKTWFKNLITLATEPLIFWVNEQPWIGTAGTGDDEWSNYSTERTELANHIAASGKTVIILAGDMHAVAYDNGANSPGRIPVFHAAPWAQTYSSKGGPYTQGPLLSAGGTVQQYGIVDVTDTGTTIQVRFRGFDTSDTVQVDATLAWITPATIAATATIGAVALPSGGTATPARLAAVTTIPAPDVLGDEPQTSPDTVIARVYMGADIEPPSVPTGLHQVGSTSATVDMAWNPATDNVAVAFYELVVAGPV